MKGKIFSGAVACLLLAWASVNCEAAEIITVQSGPWTSTTTWAGGAVPVQSDNVIVKTGHIVTIPSSGTKSCTNLTVETGGKLYANTGGSQRYVDIYGNIICNGIVGNGNVYDGISFNIESNNCLISGCGSFDASRIRKNTGLNPSTSLTIAMNVNLRYNGTAIFNNKSASNFHLIINAGCTLNCPGNSGSPGNVCIDGPNASNGSSYGGSITVNGILSVGGILYLTTDNNSATYTVSFTINSGGTVNAASVICTNSGSACHTTTVHDGGVLNFTSGSWGAIGFTNNSYDFSPASTVEYSGNGDQEIGNPASYGHLILSGSGEKTAGTGELTIKGDLGIQTPCNFIIPQNRAVTLQGNLYLDTGDGLVLKAGSSSAAPGSFINYGCISGSGTVKAEKFISQYLTSNDANYHLISSPASAQNIQPGFVADPPDHSTDFYRWDEPLALWMNSKTDSGSWNTFFQPGDDRRFHQGTGYLVASATDGIKAFSGFVTNSNLAVPVSFTAGNYPGYNLVGNPYTSALIADIQNWDKTNVRNAVWVWDPASGNYKTWNGLAGTLTDGIIPAMQGFFIKAYGPFPSLVIPASSRTHSTQQPYKLHGSMGLRLSLSGGSYRDESVLYIPSRPPVIPDSMFNVSKIYGFPDAPQLYFVLKSGMYSVMQDITPEGSKTIPIGIRKGKSDTLTFHFTGIETFSNEDGAYLEDRLENHNVNLRVDDTYVFISRHACENDRFFLHFNNTTGSSMPDSSKMIRLFSEKGDLRITGLEDFMGCEMLSIYDMEGRMVLEQLIPPGISRVSLNLAPAYYIVRLGTGRSTVSKKLFFYK
ncbi:MAG: T9SS type A sorting domain-containing protein [Bacteroidota bacterium]